MTDTHEAAHESNPETAPDTPIIVPLHLPHLVAAGLAVNPKDIRERVVGVHVEVSAGIIRIVGSDGNILFAAMDERECAGVPDLKVTIPYSMVQGIKAPKGRDAFNLNLEVHRKFPLGGLRMLRLVLTLNGTTSSREGMEVEDDYPDWRRVIPDSARLEYAQFLPHLITRLDKINTALGGEKYFSWEIFPNGKWKAALVQFRVDLNCVACIMPWKDSSDRAEESMVARIKGW